MTPLAPLFEPLRIRGMTVANRFVMSPANRNTAPGGVPGEDIAQFYRRRVDGEVGLVITGGIGIDHPAALGVATDRPCGVPELHGAALAGWQRVVELVHDGGGKIVPQLWHQGVMRAEGTGYHPEAPSSRPSGIWGPPRRRHHVDPAYAARFAEPTRALTDGEILEIIAAYARSARNAAALGFDGIAIHGGNGYLPDAFLWDGTNQRTDRWGGNRRERTRFAVEVVRAVRREAGETLPIFFRFSQWKHQDLDATLADTPDQLEEVLGPIADAGIDVFDASQFSFDDPAFAGSERNLAGWAKHLTGRAAMTAGGVGIAPGFHDPNGIGPDRAVENLDALLRRFERSEFDLVAVGRSILNDAAWTRKARLGVPFESYDDRSLRAMT
jgi:2,4-dienoyl-CoA reductase-like NADH-dependent reductase (Old Yellow Enzyme family)